MRESRFPRARKINKQVELQTEARGEDRSEGESKLPVLPACLIKGPAIKGLTFQQATKAYRVTATLFVCDRDRAEVGLPRADGLWGAEVCRST